MPVMIKVFYIVNIKTLLIKSIVFWMSSREHLV